MESQYKIIDIIYHDWLNFLKYKSNKKVKESMCIHICMY